MVTMDDSQCAGSWRSDNKTSWRSNMEGSWRSDMDISDDNGGDAMEDGDLGHGPTNKQYMDMINKDEYYKSTKFAIGYHELQSRWSDNWIPDQGTPLPQELCRDQQDDHYRLSVPGSPQTVSAALRRRQDLSLPLKICHESSIPSSPAVSRLRKQPWATLSATNSPMGTPSPRSSFPGTPVSSPCPSPRVRRQWPGPSSLAAPSCTSQASPIDTKKDATIHTSPLAVEQVEETKSRGIMDILRRIVGNFRKRRTEAPPQTPELEERVSILETELETYQQLSVAKGTAADLLKHQLMDVLYEKVVGEVEQKHRRRELEQEIMNLEFQLQLLHGATESNWRGWIDRLDKEPGTATEASSGCDTTTN